MVYAGVMSSKLKEMWFIEIDEAGIGAKRISPGSVTNTAVTRRIFEVLSRPNCDRSSCRN